MPSFSKVRGAVGNSPKMPIEPVMVAGLAQI